MSAKSAIFDGQEHDYRTTVTQPRSLTVAMPSGRIRPARRPGSVTTGMGRATTRVPSQAPASQAVTGRAEAYAREMAPQSRPAARSAPAQGRGRLTIDRLAQSEARLLAVVLIVTAIACGSLVFYLAAYAQVASLGIQQSAARVALRKERLAGETLRAQCERAASPDIIRAAATQLGMTTSPTRIAYVVVGGQPLPDGVPSPSSITRVARADSQTSFGVAPSGIDSAPEWDNVGEAANAGSVNTDERPDPRMASSGASTNTLTAATEPSAN